MSEKGSKKRGQKSDQKPHFDPILTPFLSIFPIRLRYFLKHVILRGSKNGSKRVNREVKLWFSQYVSDTFWNMSFWGGQKSDQKPHFDPFFIHFPNTSPILFETCHFEGVQKWPKMGHFWVPPKNLQKKVFLQAVLGKSIPKWHKKWRKMDKKWSKNGHFGQNRPKCQKMAILKKIEKTWFLITFLITLFQTL